MDDTEIPMFTNELSPIGVAMTSAANSHVNVEISGNNMFNATEIARMIDDRMRESQYPESFSMYHLDSERISHQGPEDYSLPVQTREYTRTTINLTLESNLFVRSNIRVPTRGDVFTHPLDSRTSGVVEDIHYDLSHDSYTIRLIVYVHESVMAHPDEWPAEARSYRHPFMRRPRIDPALNYRMSVTPVEPPPGRESIVTSNIPVEPNVSWRFEAVGGGGAGGIGGVDGRIVFEEDIFPSHDTEEDTGDNEDEYRRNPFGEDSPNQHEYGSDEYFEEFYRASHRSYEDEEEEEQFDDRQIDWDQTTFNETQEYIMDTEITNELYLKQLCGMTGRPYESLPINELLALKTKAEINKLFFSLDESAARTVEVPKEMQEKLKSFFTKNLPSHRLYHVYDEARQEYARMVDRAEKARSRLVSIKRDYDYSVERGALPFSEVFQEIAAEGKFKLEEINEENGNIFFSTVNDIILTHRDQAKAIDLQLNMGKYVVKLNFAESYAKVKPHTNNLYVSHFYHPHVNHNGNICWGNASEAVRKAWVVYDVKRILNTIHLILSEYNDESPYRDLYDFDLFRTYKSLGSYFFTKSKLDNAGINWRTRSVDSTTHRNIEYVKLPIVTKKDVNDERIYFKDSAGQLIELEHDWVSPHHGEVDFNYNPSAEDYF